MFSFLTKKTRMPAAAEALPGRPEPIPTAKTHFVNGHPLTGPYPQGMEQAIFGLGCFWGAERKFWEAGEGVYVTAVGYSGGFTPNPTYEEACSGRTGHTEAVLVVYDPGRISYERLLQIFWESHDPTQGMRQGNDVGTQYRSAIYATTPAQLAQALASRKRFGEALKAKGYGDDHDRDRRGRRRSTSPRIITSNIWPRIPRGYCGLGGTGVSCPIGLGALGGVSRGGRPAQALS